MGTWSRSATRSSSRWARGRAGREVGAALLVRELDRYRGRWPVFLLPVECAELVRLAYRLGGRNVECMPQVRGDSQPFRGVSFPTFMPETG